MLCQRLRGVCTTLMGTDNGFPAVNVFSQGDALTHTAVTQTQFCSYVKRDEWARQRSAPAQPFEELLWMLCLGPRAFLESAWLHLHILEHTPCSFVSCVLHLQQDYRSGSLTLCSAAVDSLSCFRQQTHTHIHIYIYIFPWIYTLVNK